MKPQNSGLLTYFKLRGRSLKRENPSVLCMKMMKTRKQSGFINPECFFMWVIALVIVAAATPFVSRLIESNPAVAIVLTVVGIAAIVITAALATIEAFRLQGWKVGLTIPIVMVVGILIAVISHHHKNQKNHEAENNALHGTAESRTDAASSVP